MSRQQLRFTPPHRKVGAMIRASFIVPMLLLAPIMAPLPACAAPPVAADHAYDDYVRITETRLEAQHSSPQYFLAATACALISSQSGPCIERVSVTNLPGALLHHWRATEFVRGAKARDLDRMLRDVSAYPAVFDPQVERAHATQSSTDQMNVAMRMRQHHVLTVVLDADYDVSFAQLDAWHRYSISRSERIREVDSPPGTSRERILAENEDHGFLWRQNTYWSYEERDGGLSIQVESLSLTRSVPTGLGWAVGPYVESIPRDSLEFTLRCISTALLKTQIRTTDIH